MMAMLAVKDGGEEDVSADYRSKIQTSAENLRKQFL
jgi:hypothetical protein